MEQYDFISKAITEDNVRSIIAEAGYDAGKAKLTPRVDHDGYLAETDQVMNLTLLRNAAKDLKIKVEITSPIAAAEAADDGTTYHCDFRNETPDAWAFCIYQEYPNSPGLQSVAWKQTSVPRSGESGVEWDINYLVAVVDYRQDGGLGVYKASQKLGTQLGKKWTCKFEDNVQQLFEAGDSDQDDQVIIDNKSGLMANLAIAMDGDVALVKPNVYGGNAAQFIVEPVYWVALFKDVTQGEVISGNQVHGPLQVKFAGGRTTLQFRAFLDGENFVFEQVGTGNRSVAPASQVYARADELRRRRRRATEPRVALATAPVG